MKQATRDRLHALNRDFYHSYADEFSETRKRAWRGFARVLGHLEPGARVLDVGCGNGRLAHALREHFGQHFEYTGIDASAPLLAIAQSKHGGKDVRFVRGDFVADDPELVLPRGEHDLVALFGVLHHIPGEPARRALLQAAARRLAPGGLLALTLWRYDTDPRFARRRLSPERLSELAVAEGDLDAGDHLMRWGTHEGAVRYCHFTDDAELTRLLDRTELAQIGRFRADGTRDSLNDYVVLRR